MPDAECNNNELPKFLTQNELAYIQKYGEYMKATKLKEPGTAFEKMCHTKVSAVTPDQIASLRAEINEYLAKHRSERKLTDRFIEELTQDVYLRGFIAREHKNPVEKIVDAMEFISRTEGIDDETFPKEFLEFGVNIGSGFDLWGNPIFYLFARRNFAPKKLFESTEIYMAYIVYQLVRISVFTNGFFTMFVDFSGASVANVDFNALRLLITILNDHAPACLNRCIIYNVHWALTPAFKIGYKLLPANVGDMMHMVTTKNLHEFVSAEQLSNFVEGGQNADIILGRPKKNSVSFLDVSHKVNLTIEEAGKLIEQFRKSLKKNKLELMAYE